MENQPPAQPAPAQPERLKLFGVGNAALCLLEQLRTGGLPGTGFVALNSEPESLAACGAPHKLPLKLARGERECILSQDDLAQVKECCAGAQAVFIIAGLGGVTGTSVSPVLARAARDAGALVLAFVTLPFTYEGSRRADLARRGLEELKATADGVICLPNQSISKLLEENTSLVDGFKRSGELLAEAVRGIWRLLAHKGLIEIHFDDLCSVLRDRHSESVFAVAEAGGATRSREVVDKLLAHPMLQGADVLSQAEAVLVSLMGGPDVTMAEVNRVMEQITAKCPQAQIIMGAALDESFRERLAVTLIAAGKEAEDADPEPLPRASAENLDTQLLNRADSVRPESRIVPPPPTLSPDRMAQMLARQGRPTSRSRKSSPKLRQSQLPLEIISKGRFDKSEPTIHKGEDLDVPTYIRRGVSLN